MPIKSNPEQLALAESARTIEARLDLSPGASRQIVAIAGAPGAGKSTFAEALVDHLNRDRPLAVLLPMDGFHLDNATLDDMGLRQVKGAPETFDADGYANLVAQIRGTETLDVPGFDRARDATVPAMHRIEAAHRVIVAEGNYLLLDEAPWAALGASWDLTVFLDVPEATLRQRLIDRWLTHGLDPKAAEDRAEANDLPNARRVIGNLVAPDIVLTGG